MSLQMLTLTASSTGDFNKDGSSYKVMLNPEKVTEDLTIEYKTKQGSGTSTAKVIFEKTPPPKLNFDFIIDTTGVVDSTRTDLLQEITDLKAVVYDYQSSTHSPNWVTAEWGTNTYNGRLTSLKIEYNLFKVDGSPLRAKVSLAITVVPASTKSTTSSPDMTHKKVVSVGNTLHKLTEDVYSDPAHLIKVAQVNKLDSIIHLQPGQQLTFPPIKSN